MSLRICRTEQMEYFVRLPEVQPPLTSSTACEWNPVEDREAHTTDENHALATVLLGSNGKYRLCAECAALPRFKRMKVRKAIVWQKTDGST